ncbi:hypothetical protein fHeYen902_090c [Yersinia phage fHe-Yen9-02]|nr:hypothetical protein fHeYen902_090c [Yersinia phage fHe-Yen9-02]
MTAIKLNLGKNVKSESSVPTAFFMKALDKKSLYAMLVSDGMPSDISGPNDILDFRFLNYNGDTARFGVLMADEDEGFNVIEVGIKISCVFGDSDNQSTLAKAKDALRKMK